VIGKTGEPSVTGETGVIQCEYVLVRKNKKGDHQNMLAWQMANSVNILVHSLVKSMRNLDWKTQRQVLNSADSEVANLVEGYYGGSTGEFIRFSRYARRSCAELHERMIGLLRRGILEDGDYLKFDELNGKTGYMIDQLTRGLEKKREKDKSR